MNIREFMQLVKKDFWFITIAVLIVVGGVFAYNHKTKTTYEGTVGFSVVRFGQETKSEFNDYYATQADNLVTANFAKWLSSKAFLANAYKEAGKNLDQTNLDVEIRSVKAAKVSGTDINFIYQADSKQTAESMGNAVISLVGERSAQIKKSNASDVNLRGLEVSSKLQVYQKTINQSLNYLLGIVSGLILGIIVILLKNYWASQK